MKSIEPPTAYLDWSLIVECPKCEEDIDLVPIDADNGYLIADRIFKNDWDSLRETEVTCPNCKHEFQIKGVEY